MEKNTRTKTLFQYIYDAVGVKLRKTVSRGATTDDAGNVVYENSALK